MGDQTVFLVYGKAYAEWRGAHPAGNAEGHDGFNVMPLVLAEAKS